MRLYLLLNERVVNMPPELAPSLHESLLRDLEWARANAGDEETKGALGGLKTLVALAPCFSERASEAEVAAVAAAGANAAGRKAGGKARKPRHDKAGASSSASSSSSSAAAAEEEAAPASSASSTAGIDATNSSSSGSGNGEVASSSSSSSSSVSSSSSKKDPLGLGPGWATHFLHFEEELYDAQAVASFGFRVRDYEKGEAGVVGDIGAESSSSSSSSSSSAAVADKSAGKKRKADAAAAAVPVPEAASSSKSLRPPASRRFLAFPISAMPLCVEAMKHLLVEAQGK